MPTATNAKPKAITKGDVRTPTHRDLKALKAIISEGTDEAKKALIEVSKEASGSEIVSGVTVLNVILDEFDDVMYWVGGLAGFEWVKVKNEQGEPVIDELTGEPVWHHTFDDQPYNAHQQIVDVLIERDNLIDFFGWYIRTMQRFSGLLNRKSASGTELPTKK